MTHPQKQTGKQQQETVTGLHLATNPIHKVFLSNLILYISLPL
jgi:hypothetical protein